MIESSYSSKVPPPTRGDALPPCAVRPAVRGSVRTGLTAGHAVYVDLTRKAMLPTSQRVRSA